MQKKTKQTKQIKELFVQDLAKIQGGKTVQATVSDGCPEITTTACGEEPPPCIGC